MQFDVVALFPEVLAGYLGQSLVRQAIDRQRIGVRLHDLRDWAKDKHRTVDDRPFGGGPGMIFKVEPVVECVEAVQEMGSRPGHVVLLTPRGRRLTQEVVEELARHQRLVLVCGRYEGFDQRVVEILEPDELSVGDYVLGGGEVAAMVVIDAVARLVPGVLGDDRSNKDDSFSRPGRTLEYAQYTRPRDYRGHQVPEVLLHGNHPEIARWRAQQSLKTTQQRRADLLG